MPDTAPLPPRVSALSAREEVLRLCARIDYNP